MLYQFCCCYGLGWGSSDGASRQIQLISQSTEHATISG